MCRRRAPTPRRAELATAREGLVQAERIAADATEGRDLAGIALETTRSELAERTEALDAERSASQARIADLVAQLATATRTAESATERSADLESRLDTAITARDDAVAQAESLTDQLARARTDTEQLRTQAASIGDELAANQAALETARSGEQSARARRRTAAAARGESRARTLAVAPIPRPRRCDGARRVAGDRSRSGSRRTVPEPARHVVRRRDRVGVPPGAGRLPVGGRAGRGVRRRRPRAGKTAKKPATKFRTAEPDAATPSGPGRRARGRARSLARP